MANFYLTKKETKNKKARFSYEVKDSEGNVLATRSSNRFGLGNVIK